jgi:DNA repair protein RecO (recombination protein O)
MIVTSEAIILNSRKYGDTSKIITVFSSDYGKISFIAKGARMPKNKFGSSLEPLSCSSATFYLKPNTELYLLSKSEISKKWTKIYKSEEHLTSGFMIIETISKSQLGKNPNIELYDLLNLTLEQLNQLKPNPNSLVICFFCKFAELMGFELNLFEFNLYPHSLTTILIDTGSVVPNALSHHNKTFKLTNELAAKLYEISISEIEMISEIELNRNEFSTLNNFFSIYFSYHLDFSFVLKSGNIF